MWMSQAHMTHAWDHTAALMCLTANLNRDAKKKCKPFKVEDFHPFRTVRQKVASKEDLTMIKHALGLKGR